MATGYKNKEMTQKTRIPTVRVLFSISPAPRIHDHDWHMILFASRYMCPLNAWNSASLLIAFPYSFASLLLLPCHHLDNTARVPRNLFPDPHHHHGSLVLSFVQDYNASQCDFPITTSIQVAPFLSCGSIHKGHTYPYRTQHNPATTLVPEKPQQGYPKSKSILDPFAFLIRTRFDSVAHLSTSICLSG